MAAHTTDQTPRGHNTLHVAIVGAGIGGLSCAIACRKADKRINVTVIERAPEVLAVGAGIHIPPNACRVMEHFGLLEKLKQAGGYQVEDFTLRRYQDGKILVEKPLKNRVEYEYGSEWIAIHRGDYQEVLLTEAANVGANLITHAQVTDIDISVNGVQTIILKDGRRMTADVVIGADGLWSRTREIILGEPFSPLETGDLAYRGTFTREQMKAFKNERIDKLIEQSNINVWMGPSRHAVFYPLRNHTEYNLVLLVADDLPAEVRTAMGDVGEMAAGFNGWDPILSDIISCSKSAMKWKLLHFKELDQWTKGSVALLGDATHPTLPYQGQGAAMAVEDGAILGILLSKLIATEIPWDTTARNALLRDLFLLYEGLRKKRTATNVEGAVHTRHYYHLHDGEEQRDRDQQLAKLASTKWQGRCSFNWGDAQYQKSLLGFDVLADAASRYDEWYRARSGALENHKSML